MQTQSKELNFEGQNIFNLQVCRPYCYKTKCFYSSSVPPQAPEGDVKSGILEFIIF